MMNDHRWPDGTNPPKPLARAPGIARWPWLSGAAIALPALCMILRYRAPGLWLALQRDPAALGRGEWWRALSPLLINSAGWGQFAAVSLGFALVGAAVERRWGRWRWLLLFAAGALIGELAAYTWLPRGGGTSNALCGLLGGWLLATASDDPAERAPAAIYALALVTSLAGIALAGRLSIPIGVGIGAGALANGLLLQRFVRLRRGRLLLSGSTPLLARVIVVEAAILAAARDEHGPSILAGAGVALILERLTTHHSENHL